ncbi:MAG: glycosyltransferase family 2 protein [Acidimicrobiia bacterium]
MNRRSPWRLRAGWWNLRARRFAFRRTVRVYRAVAGRKPVRDGITVVSVNYNSLPQVRVLLAALERYTTEPIDVIVVDNASEDGSREFLRAQPNVRPILLPLNIGHGFALDLAVLSASTSIVVVFDIDAFPISPGWLRAVADPLEHGAAIAGAHLHRAYIHPCFLALRRSDFLEYGLSFVPVGRCPSPEVPATGLYLDAGEAVSHVLSLAYGTKAIHKLPPTSHRGPGVIGTVFGDVVYHNFYSTHGRGEMGKAAAEAWDDAVRQYVDPVSAFPTG